MKIKRLGIEWGAAYEEAQAHLILHNTTEIELYVTESGEIEFIFPLGFSVAPRDDGKLRVTLGGSF